MPRHILPHALSFGYLAHFEGSSFERAILIDTRWPQTNLTDANFVEAVLSGADFITATLDGAQF